MYCKVAYWFLAHLEGLAVMLGLAMLAVGLALYSVSLALAVTGAIVLLLAIWPSGGKPT